jgi:hypothetical protein
VRDDKGLPFLLPTLRRSLCHLATPTGFSFCRVMPPKVGIDLVLGELAIAFDRLGRKLVPAIEPVLGALLMVILLGSTSVPASASARSFVSSRSASWRLAFTVVAGLAVAHDIGAASNFMRQEVLPRRVILPLLMAFPL